MRCWRATEGWPHWLSVASQLLICFLLQVAGDAQLFGSLDNILCEGAARKQREDNAAREAFRPIFRRRSALANFSDPGTCFLRDIALRRSLADVRMDISLDVLTRFRPETISA